MIFDKESGMQQVKELLHLYTGLQLSSEDSEQFVLSGYIGVNRTSKGYTLCKKYQIEIIVPILSKKLPYVVDIGQNIDKNYPHRYMDGRLCLETDTCIRIRFIEGFSLPIWVSEYVEPYFFSYEYYTRYGEFPFGERGHDLVGVLQTYEDLFEESNAPKVFNLMASIATQHYRGHMLCPCGSGKKLRVCHGRLVMRYYTDKRLQEIVCTDYQMIRKVLVEYDEQRRNSEQTKR